MKSVTRLNYSPYIITNNPYALNFCNLYQILDHINANHNMTKVTREQIINSIKKGYFIGVIGIDLSVMGCIRVIDRGKYRYGIFNSLKLFERGTLFKLEHCNLPRLQTIIHPLTREIVDHSIYGVYGYMTEDVAKRRLPFINQLNEEHPGDYQTLSFEEMCGRNLKLAQLLQGNRQRKPTHIVIFNEQIGKHLRKEG